ncbi:transglutaminase-like putative cysteine protease [Actinocorallia herbida]|uniref:Transglutaminase-like putative cysteine protease n=1 Tax=Actinocorallia herbida TaxID=58109 RepID=A0A3N1CQZ0_9ACTN|nr:transglutaminase family protein [Actinocorallia herbida]ROO83736.1 transglutaminase-like putative cysteine protease [Actinocorallia herbida]
MGWRLQITHTTRVSYDGDARASYNEVRMAPLTLPGQTVLGNRLTVEPHVPVWSYWDYWGSEVSSFDLQGTHEELVLVARSTVETSAPAPLPDSPSWSELPACVESLRLEEYLVPTPRTELSADLAEEVRALTAGAEPHEAALLVSGRVHDRLAYVPGVTSVYTSAQEAWEDGRGVCQDFAHLAVGMLREVGLPARYVSGYLHPDPSASPGDTLEGQSHAWIEYWAGDWVPYDPTNGISVGERHVTVARGRDYTDVPPLKGIYHGAPSSTMDVRVEVTRLG